ncbi:MAG: hypothetical protein FD129_2998 [bacterium]|nr:MAG: hypothetical protein FD129_2998 [bacterium]
MPSLTVIELTTTTVERSTTNVPVTIVTGPMIVWAAPSVRGWKTTALAELPSSSSGPLIVIALEISMLPA